MSKVLAHTRDTNLTLDAGYDPATGVYFLDVYHPGDEDPRYESMFMHPKGLTTYALPELAADLERECGRPLPELITAITDLGPVPNVIRRLGLI